MERLQVLLRPEEMSAIRGEAARLGVSMSEVVRRALRELTAEDAVLDENDPLWGIIGIGDKDFKPGPGSDPCGEIDCVVYDLPCDEHGKRT